MSMTEFPKKNDYLKHYNSFNSLVYLFSKNRMKQNCSRIPFIKIIQGFFSLQISSSRGKKCMKISSEKFEKVGTISGLFL